MFSIEKSMNEMFEEYFRCMEMTEEVQQRVLMNIIKTNSETVYGRKHNFENIKSIEDFENEVPINDYSSLKDFIEKNKYENNVILKDDVSYWAMTSGTSGTQKYIPHTKESLNLWTKGALRSLGAFIKEEHNMSVANYKYMFIVAPALVKKINSIPAGYISGIIPAVSDTIKQNNLIDDKVNSISNYKEKIQKMFELSLENPISAFAGITTFTANFINYVHENGYEMARDNPIYLDRIRNCLNDDRTVNVSKLWPHLKFCLSTGTNINIHRDRILKLLPDIWIANLYAGTEGAYGFSMESGTDILYLNYDLYYYEFKDIESGKIYNLANVKKNSPYELIITSCNGLYRYTNGDLIEFVSLKPPMIKVLGRSNVMINLGGEKFNEYQINKCVISTVQELRLTINDYCFFGWIDDESCVHHCLAIEKNKGQYNVENISKTLFENLKRDKAFYKRNAGELFKIPNVIILKEGTFRKLGVDIANRKKIIGHSKVKHICKYDEIKKLIHLEYILECNVPLDIKEGFYSDERSYAYN